MRFLLAAVLFVFSVALLLLGIAERTIWASPTSVSVNFNTSSESPYLIIEPEQLAHHPGSPKVQVVGEAEVFVAFGLPNDVAAFVGETNHLKITKNEDTDSLVLTSFLGNEDYVSPVETDLWQEYRVAKNKISLTVPADKNLSVLIASDGLAPVPSQIRLTWPIVTSTFLSDFELISGTVLLVLALIMNLLAIRMMRINRGPRRKVPKAPQGPKYRPKRQPSLAPERGRRSAKYQKLVTAPIAIGLIFSLSACSTETAPTETPSGIATEDTSTALPPVVTELQLTRILAEITTTITQSDTTGDIRELASRVAGPALSFRESYYLLMSKSEDIPPPAPITAKPISVSMPSSTDIWPRSIMVVTAAPSAAELPQMLVLQQDAPREKYKLWFHIPLLPGSEIPEVPSSEIGSIPVESDSLFLKLSPNLLATAFGDVIDKGTLSESYGLFDLTGDEFYNQVSKSQSEQIAGLKKAQITFSHSLGDPNVISLSTSDSGALVALMMHDSYVIKPTKAGSAVAVSGSEQLLLGVEGSTRGVRTVYGDMLLFYVPAATSDGQIVLLGATQALLSVRSL